MVAFTSCVSPSKTYSGAVASSYCMSVSNSSDGITNTHCTACLNWDGLARIYVAGAACGAALSTTAIADCQVYSGTVLAAASSTNPDYTSCQRCKKSYYNVTVPVTGNSVVKCDSAMGTGCINKIDECYQTKCYNGYTNNLSYSSQFCNICNNGYQPAGIDVHNFGALECVMGTTLRPNCVQIQANTASYNMPYCYACAKDFAVGASGQGCVGYTWDENCRKMNDNANSDYYGCVSCFSAYYFMLNGCVLGAKLFAGIGLVFLGLLLFH